MSRRWRYEPFDQEKWLGRSPWSPDDPSLQAWEFAHGHDVRLKCLPEFGCQVIESNLERRAEAAERALADIRELHKPIEPFEDGKRYCDHCVGEWVAGAGELRLPITVPYPCPTIRILDDTGDER